MRMHIANKELHRPRGLGADEALLKSLYLLAIFESQEK